MSSCVAFRQMVVAYVDGELVGEEREALEEHLERCAACPRLLDEERTVLKLLQSSQPLAQAPAELRERITRLAAPSPTPRRAWRWLAAAAVLGLGIAGALLAARWGRRLPDPATTSTFAALAADTHLRYARGQLPLEVTSERPEQVSGWFTGRVPFHLALPDYPVGPGEQKFYRLEGGRLVAFRDDYAAYVAYRMGDQPVSLLVTDAFRVAPEGGEIVTSGRLSFHVERVAGLQIITWSDNGLTYALASDVTVSAARSCMVCHGAPDQHHKVEGFRPRT